MNNINKALAKRPFTRQAAPVSRLDTVEALSDVNIYSEAVISERNVIVKSQADFLAEYDPRGHKIYNKAYYPDKIIKNPDTGKQEGVELVARVALGLQKMIALKQAVHLIGNSPKLTSAKGTDSELFIKYKEYRRLKGIKDAMYLGVKSALETGDGAIWFYKDGKGRLKWKVWSYQNGDTLIPTYEKGILKKMARRYWSVVDGKTTDTVDIITDRIYSTYIKKAEADKSTLEKISEAVGLSGEWARISSASHGFTQVPVAYQRNEDVAWGDGQELIDIIERTLSDLRESDSYYALGILVLTGDVSVLPNKGHQGKVISGEEGADAKLLEQSDVSQGFKFELETYFERLFDITGTVVIRHADLKGGDITGAAIRNYYNPAIQYAMDKAPLYYDFLNQIEAITIEAMGMEYNMSLAVKSMEVISEIDIYVPANTMEVAQKIQYLVAAGVLSKETAQEHSEFSAPDEYERLTNEAAVLAASSNTTIDE